MIHIWELAIREHHGMKRDWPGTSVLTPGKNLVKIILSDELLYTWTCTRCGIGQQSEVFKFPPRGPECADMGFAEDCDEQVVWNVMES